MGVRACVPTFKHKYLHNQQAYCNRILSEASLGWRNGCIRFKARLDQNSGFPWQHSSHRVLKGENSVVTFYAPNFEKVGSILLSACPSVCLFVRPFKKNLKLGFRNFIYGFLVKK